MVIFAIVVPRFMTVSERMGMPLLIIYLVVAALFMFSDIIGDFIGKMLKATPLAKLRMAKAKAEDEKLEADSKERREVQLKEWNEVKLPKYRAEMKKKIEAYGNTMSSEMEEAKKFEARVAENDVVAEDDKSLETVGNLIYLMETKRADTIKEALNLYDAMVARQEDRELTMQAMAEQQANFDRMSGIMVEGNQLIQDYGERILEGQQAQIDATQQQTGVMAAQVAATERQTQAIQSVGAEVKKFYRSSVADRQRMISATNNVAWQTYMNRPA